MFIPLKLILIGFDPSPYAFGIDWWPCFVQSRPSAWSCCTLKPWNFSWVHFPHCKVNLIWNCNMFACRACVYMHIFAYPILYINSSWGWQTCHLCNFDHHLSLAVEDSLSSGGLMFEWVITTPTIGLQLSDHVHPWKLNTFFPKSGHFQFESRVPNILTF